MVKAAQKQVAAPTSAPPVVTTVDIDAGLGFSAAPVAHAPAAGLTAAQKMAATKAANKAAAEAAALAAAANVVEDATLVDPLAGIGAAAPAGPTAEELSAALGL